MLLLDNYHNRRIVATYDDVSGSFTEHERPQESVLNFRSSSGKYSILGGKLVCLFRKNDVVYLTVDQYIFDFVKDAVYVDTVQLNPRTMRITIKSTKCEDITWDYPYVEWRIPGDFTMASAEDFDYGMFLNNVTKNSERRELLVASLGNPDYQDDI